MSDWQRVSGMTGESLDRYITGNYGEDSVGDDEVFVTDACADNDHEYCGNWDRSDECACSCHDRADEQDDPYSSPTDGQWK